MSFMGGALLVKGALPQTAQRKKPMLALATSTPSSTAKCRYAELDPASHTINFWKNQFKHEWKGAVDLGQPPAYAISLTPNGSNGPPGCHFTLVPKRRVRRRTCPADE